MNTIERAIYNHFLSGSTRGDLYKYVKMGKAGVALKGATGKQRAAWKAGKELATGALSVTCPRSACLAPPGNPCLGLIRSHRVRYEAARAVANPSTIEADFLAASDTHFHASDTLPVGPGHGIPRWAFEEVERERCIYFGIEPNMANVDAVIADPHGWAIYHAWAASIERKEPRR